MSKEKEVQRRVSSLRNYYESLLYPANVSEAICMNCALYEPQEYRPCAKPCINHQKFCEKSEEPMRRLVRKLDVANNLRDLYGSPPKGGTR